MADRPVVILGAGGHAKVVVEMGQAAGINLAGVLDPDLPAGSSWQGLPVLGGDERLGDAAFVAQHGFIVGVARGDLRQSLWARLLVVQAELAIIVHPSAVISPSACLAPGVVVMPGVVVNAGAVIGPGAILNTACSVDHDCRLEEGVHIGPGAHLAGNVQCGPWVEIGAGVVIIPGIRIGAHARVGAGATVIREVPPGVTVAGNPARPMG